MTTTLNTTNQTRINRSGIVPVSNEQGLALLDAALGSGHASLVAAQFDQIQLQRRANSLPPLLRHLVRTPAHRTPVATNAANTRSIAEELAGRTRQEQRRVLLDLVRTSVAAVLGHDSALGIEDQRAFKELGFDSLIAVELRNRLAGLTGLRLPATLLFDHPTPEALAEELCGLLVPEAWPDDDFAAQEADIRQVLRSIPLTRLRDAGLLDALLRLTDTENPADAPAATSADAIDDMSAESLIRLALDDSRA